MTTGRIENQSGVDLSDLPAVRQARQDASDIGHWRRIVALYGDHLEACAIRRPDEQAGGCDCGFAQAFE